MFVGITQSQTVVNDLYWLGIDKNWQPVNNGEGDKIDIDTIDEFITIHDIIIFDRSGVGFLSENDFWRPGGQEPRTVRRPARTFRTTNLSRTNY